jgi:hypothetical protein
LPYFAPTSIYPSSSRSLLTINSINFPYSRFSLWSAHGFKDLRNWDLGNGRDCRVSPKLVYS